jgi:Tannase-like family of unknown function (DUF6351)
MPTGTESAGADALLAGGVRGDLSCNGTWQYYGAPRIAAGGSLSQDVMKCQTKPLSRADYGVIAFTDEQWARLQAAFPTGVCDYSRPGVSQRPPKARWLTFAGGPGGQPLGDPPGSQGPADLLAELGSMVEGFSENPAANLRNLLASAQHHLAKSRLPQACETLDHFSRRVAKESGRTLSEADAGRLEAAAADVRTLLGC